MKSRFSIHTARRQADRVASSGVLSLLCGLLITLAAGCTEERRGTDISPHPTSLAETPAEVVHDVAAPDLAVLMGELQRHSMKLGYSIENENPQLAGFYAHEVEEVLESVEQIESHDGVPISAPARGTVTPALEALEAALSTGDWNAATVRYRALIAACNDCHEATQHGFIAITEPPQPPPFNQSFAAGDATP